MSTVFDYIDLNEFHRSKSICIANGIVEAIENKAIHQGEALPSVNKFILKLGVARMTVVKALNILKEQGIIISVDKIGYFVKDENIRQNLKVLLLLTGFHSYQEVVYNQIIEGVKGCNVTIDLFFHHCNAKIFNSIIRENLGLYGLYIITGFKDPSVESCLSRIPKRKLLQILRPPLLPDVSSISQDFYTELKKSLDLLAPKLEQYEEFILVFPSERRHPKGIRQAFVEFCEGHEITYDVVEKIDKRLITPGRVFGVIEDSDLLSTIQFSEEKGYQIGHEIGLISYNETPMKKMIRNGITVLSADFFSLGKAISQFICKPEPTVKVFPPQLFIRSSI
ncbi:MAG: GntR family transcriptional regulator [Bacteroidota bacterium]